MNPWQNQLEALGEFIRTQRKLANLSLRELAAMTDVSNAYLSQIERGLHEPSVRVLRSIAQALEISANTVLAQAGLVLDDFAPPHGATEEDPGPSFAVAGPEGGLAGRRIAATRVKRRKHRGETEVANVSA